MILRNITTGDRILTYVFPNLNWELLVKLDNFSGFGTIPLFALFIYSLYKADFPILIRNIILVIGATITLLVFATPAYFYGKFIMFFELYILIFGLYLTFGVLLRATIRRRETAFFTFLGMFILYATAINDVLSSMGIVQSAYVAPYGLVAFMFIQSITITVKSAKAINENEQLGEELTLEKENLEKRIQERTQELQKQHDELIIHQEKEKEQTWVNNGLNIINDILADNKNDFKALSSKVLSQLVKYVDATFGVLYMISTDAEGEEDYLELIADYGCSNEIRKDKAQIHITTGMLGVAYNENRLMVINDVPENYIKIESGLGKARPEALLLVPLSIDEKVFGIIEIAGFHKFKALEVDFIKRIAYNVANNLNTIRMNENNATLIAKFKEQAQEMREKEEEMRQNMEELQATQEESTRKSDEIAGILTGIDQFLLKAEFDLNASLILANELFLNKFRYSLNEARGKEIEEFVANKDIGKFQEILNTVMSGKSHQEITYLKDKNENELKLVTSFTPVFINESFDKILFLGIDISDYK